jgi:hypothetical protein
MPLTNYPGGQTSFGIPLFGQGSVYDMPTGNVWFVCNRTGVVNGDGTSRNAPFVSIADALARVVGTNGNQGDVIFVLSGHAENVTASNVFSGTSSTGPNTGAQVIQAGVRIIGEGQSTARPTLTFTAAASTIALANQGSTIENMILLCPQTGTTTTAAMVTVTAAGCKVLSNRFNLSSSATALATTGISTSSAASDCMIAWNTGDTVTGTPTSWMAPTGTVGANRITIANNNIQALLSATTGGCVDLTANSGTAPADWNIYGNLFINKTASSTVALKGVANCTGTVAENYLGLQNGSGGATAINTPGNWNMFQNFGGTIGKQGIAITPIST